MKIAYYMPLKPLGHPNPSGDLVFGTELYSYLRHSGHTVEPASRLRCRWIYLKPGKLLKLLRERSRVTKTLATNRPDAWLSYHSYYKAPDLLGPYCAKRLDIPYILFQGIYSTKQRRKLKSKPGFYLNRNTLTSTDLIFTNKRRDEENLLRLLPRERVCYISPGLHTEQFRFNDSARNQIRNKLQITNKTVIMTAAMFRPGVKTEGLKQVIHSCGELKKEGRNLHLVIAGDGQCRDELHNLGKEILGNDIYFTGKIRREELFRYYSTADIFAFPGIEESLGMVYLEAQSCSLPVVAYEDWGGKEAVVNEVTGLLSPASSPDNFTQNIDRLIKDRATRSKLGSQASAHVREHHELSRSYSLLEQKLIETVKNYPTKY